MPQIEQNMYSNALNQATPDIVHWINMPTMNPPPPLPNASFVYIFVLTGVSPGKRKKVSGTKMCDNISGALYLLGLYQLYGTFQLLK